LSDVGALAWVTLRGIVPASSMALFIDDEEHDQLAVAYAAGPHASLLRTMTKARGAGIAGWAAANRRGVLNADPALDLGHIAGSLEPPLRSSLTVPLAHDGRVVGVLSCYGGAAQAFTEDHLRLLELLAASLAAAVAAVAPGRAQSLPRAAPGAAAPRRSNVLTMAS
jgi:GAF domain-containing protein